LIVDGRFEKLDRRLYFVWPSVYIAIVSSHTKRGHTPTGFPYRQVRTLGKQEFHDGDTGVPARIDERILKEVARFKRRPVGTDPSRAWRHSHLRGLPRRSS